MRAVITVAGTDTVGIIAAVTTRLAENKVNILDITQTILPPDFFTMVMLVEAEGSTIPFGDLAESMTALGEELGLAIHALREETFQAMHRI